MSDTLSTIVIDRLTDYKYELKSNSLLITFDDYRDRSVLEFMNLNNEYIEITIKSNQFHYVVYITSVYLEDYVTRISLCKYQTTECITVLDSNTISVYYHGDRVCINSKCFDVEKTYPVEIVFKVKTYDTSPLMGTYRFTLKEITAINLLDIIVMSVVLVTSVMFTLLLIQNLYEE